jgi:hypothetical protein
VFQAPNNPQHHPDPPTGPFPDPQSPPTNSGPVSDWAVDHLQSWPMTGAAVPDAQAHAGGEWPGGGC